jgi:hypothetical protein
VTAANRHDVTQLIPLVDGIPPLRGRRGAPVRKPALIQGDRGYDSQPVPARKSIGQLIRTSDGDLNAPRSPFLVCDRICRATSACATVHRTKKYSVISRSRAASLNTIT